MVGEFLERTVASGGRAFGFQVYRAPDLPSRPPMILFLHGYGESGTDNARQAEVGLGKALREHPERWPFLTVFPQKPDGELWPKHLDMLVDVIDQVQHEFAPDRSRMYLTGLSKGGHGTLNLSHEIGLWRFAAVAPVCGWADPRWAADALESTPTWLFHGALDQAVVASCSQAVYDTMVSRKHRDVNLTIYPKAAHNSWDPAYAEPDLPAWFLKHALEGER